MKKIIVLILSVSFIFSCQDATDIVQDGELNDAALFTDVSNLQLFLNETYDRVSIQSDIMLSSRLTDEIGMGNAGFPELTHQFLVFPTNGFASAIWSQHYQSINYANRLLRGAALFTPPAADLARYNNILAQARVIRAFCHFQLLTYFSTDLSNNAALGVMKVDFVPSALQDIPRATNGEVFELIESDLAFAEANITMPTTGGENWRFINRNMINAFKARMYLYRKDYARAEQFADLAIASPGIALANCLSTNTSSANFPPTSALITFTAAQTTALTAMENLSALPADAPPYRRMWTDQIQGEAIFSLARQNNNTNFSSQYNTNQSNFGGGALWDMGRTLFNLYTQPLGGGAQDFRRYSFVDRTSTIQAIATNANRDNEVLVIDKYCGKAGGNSSNDLKVFRMAEMHFIKAECRANAADFAGAANQIRLVRQARSYTAGTVPTPVYANATQAYADILLERRKELCFEGHRYIDLKRIGTLAGVTETDRFNTDSVVASAINPFNISVTDYRFTLPIPQIEINVNPLIQNPGYQLP